MCTEAQIEQYYDPTNLACWQTNPEGWGYGASSCPVEGQTVQCLMQAGWGMVAGSCSSCESKCSTTGASGAASCAALACLDVAPTSAARTSDELFGISCTGNSWIAETSPIDPSHTDGYCDCSPYCGYCLHAEEEEVGVTSSYCDARNGTTVSKDWASCWDSCVDCMGDDGAVSFMPEQMCLGIVGSHNWTTLAVAHTNYTGTWWLCSDDTYPPTSCNNMGVSPLPDMPKFATTARARAFSCPSSTERERHTERGEMRGPML